MTCTDDCATQADTSAFTRLHDAARRGDERELLVALEGLFEVFPPALDWFVEHTSLTPRMIAAALRQGRVRAFMHEPDEDGESWSPVDESESVEDLLVRAESVDRVQAALAELECSHPREALLVRGCHGIGSEPRRQADVASELGVSNERARQLRRQGQRRMRAWMEARR